MKMSFGERTRIDGEGEVGLHHTVAIDGLEVILHRDDILKCYLLPETSIDVLVGCVVMDYNFTSTAFD